MPFNREGTRDKGPSLILAKYFEIKKCLTPI